jgi:hypothetical protein
MDENCSSVSPAVLRYCSSFMPCMCMR